MTTETKHDYIEPESCVICGKQDHPDNLNEYRDYMYDSSYYTSYYHCAECEKEYRTLKSNYKEHNRYRREIRKVIRKEAPNLSLVNAHSWVYDIRITSKSEDKMITEEELAVLRKYQICYADRPTYSIHVKDEIRAYMRMNRILSQQPQPIKKTRKRTKKPQPKPAQDLCRSYSVKAWNQLSTAETKAICKRCTSNCPNNK